MSCWHGNHEDECDLCDEKDDAFNRGYEAGMAKALAQPQQAPIGYWMGEFKDNGATLYKVPQLSMFGHTYQNIPLYSSPQRTWVGLTTADQKEIQRQSVYVEGAIRMTEAKLKEKNHD